MNADKFVNFYESKNWYVGKNKMKDWKAAVRNWEASEKEKQNQTSNDSSGRDKLKALANELRSRS